MLVRMANRDPDQTASLDCVWVRPLIKVCTQKLFFVFLNQTHVVGTQKNRLNETVLLSTQNICLN